MRYNKKEGKPCGVLPFYLLRFTSTSALINLASSYSLKKRYISTIYPINIYAQTNSTSHNSSRTFTGKSRQETQKSRTHLFFSREWGFSETSFDCATRAHPFTPGGGMGGRVKNLQAVRTLSRPPTLDMEKTEKHLTSPCVHTQHWDKQTRSNSKQTCFVKSIYNLVKSSPSTPLAFPLLFLFI